MWWNKSLISLFFCWFHHLNSGHVLISSKLILVYVTCLLNFIILEVILSQNQRVFLIIRDRISIPREACRWCCYWCCWDSTSRWHPWGVQGIWCSTSCCYRRVCFLFCSFRFSMFNIFLYSKQYKIWYSYLFKWIFLLF